MRSRASVSRSSARVIAMVTTHSTRSIRVAEAVWGGGRLTRRRKPFRGESQQLVRKHVRHDLSIVPQSHFLKNVRSMRADRLHADAEIGGDLTGRFAGSDHEQHLKLTIGKLFVPVASPVGNEMH